MMHGQKTIKLFIFSFANSLTATLLSNEIKLKLHLRLVDNTNPLSKFMAVVLYSTDKSKSCFL
jgi:hypothetical protein